MKKLKLLFILPFLIISTITFSQRVIKTETDIYTLIGPYDFEISKVNIATGAEEYKVQTKIPNKANKEFFVSGSNNFRFDLVNDNLVIIYDVYQKANVTKDCFIKLFNIKTKVLSEPILINSTPIKRGTYSDRDIIYKQVYSPDKSKLAVLRDNVTASNPVEPEIKIYDTKTFKEISVKNISSKYENKRRVFDTDQFTIDNEGNISIVFHLFNEVTEITGKSYTSSIPFNEKGLVDIVSLGKNTSSDRTIHEKTNGRFYKTMEDYENNNPIYGYRIKRSSFHYASNKTTFELIDDNGDIEKVNIMDLPTQIFTYKEFYFDSTFLAKVLADKAALVLVYGKFNYYKYFSSYSEPYFFSDKWGEEPRKFKENEFEEYLKPYNLYDAFRADKPKRQATDDVLDWVNKNEQWYIKYFNILNLKVKE